MQKKNFYALIDEPTQQNIEANRHGTLTSKQRTDLEGVAESRGSAIMLFGGTALPIIGVVIFMFWKFGGVTAVLSPPALFAIGSVAVGVIVLVLRLAGGDFMFIFPRDEIEHGRVDSVVGKVIWTGKRYRMVSDSRKLHAPLAGRVLPPPGDYRFYCLPDSGWVLMAEELVASSQPRDLALDALGRANHFSNEELETNRQGWLSGNQELRLIGAGLFQAVFVLICIFGGWFLFQKQLGGSNQILLVLLIVVAMILLLRDAWGALRIFWDVWDGKVVYVDGRVTRHIYTGRHMRYYAYQVNAIKFYVSNSAYNALIEGDGYRVYFSPHSKRLMAIEPLKPESSQGQRLVSH